MPVNISTIIANSNVVFGTSGARGLVTDFSNEVCAAFTQSFVRSMQQSFEFERVAVGIDNRPSSPQMAAACIGLLQAMGIATDYYGVLPTPALAFQAMQDEIPAIMLTGSHIPFDRNGIKFYRPDGEISKSDEVLILSQHESLISFTPHLPVVSSVATENYISRYLRIYPAEILTGKHIGIYEHSSAGRDIYYRVFESLGAKVTRLERSDVFVPIDTEAVNEADIVKGQVWAEQYGFDAVFSTDGDGDRPLVADELGDWLRGDVLGLLCAKALGVKALAVPVSCNTAIELSGDFNQVVRTKIGSPYVISAFDKLKKQASFAGFEANGGFILGSDILVMGKALKALPTRDALLPVLALLVMCGGRRVSEMLNLLPHRFTASDRIQDVPTAWSLAFLTQASTQPRDAIKQLGLGGKIPVHIDQTDGLRMTFSDGDIVHLRPSGNAPELRCYGESVQSAKAQALVAKVLSAVKELLA